MYRIETTSGNYAIKLLNPEEMKRPNVFVEYQTAESLERKLQDNGIPIVPALEFAGNKMQCINNQYFYVFDWVDGKELDSEEIQKQHCKIMGKLSACIHRIEQSDKPFDADNADVNWDYYIELSKERCPEITDLLSESKTILNAGQTNRNAAIKKLPAVTSICHGDMDSKNVLWVNEKPLIIDLECLSYGNPYMEMYSLALAWSGYEHRCVDYELLQEFVKSYGDEYGAFNVDWEVLYNSDVETGWLEHNVKRALMLECENEEERQLGIRMVKRSIKQVYYYDSIKDELLSKLGEISEGIMK